MSDDISVHVPCSAVEAYTRAPYWSHFNHIEGEFEYFFSATSGDITRGSVTIVHAPTCDNIEAHMQANPYHGFHFEQWNDGSTQNPRYVVVTADTMLVAYFAPDSTEGIGDIEVMAATVSCRNGQIVVEGATDVEVVLYDIMGRRLAEQRADGTPLRFSALSAGIYLVRVGQYPAQKVAVMR